ncbi:MAG TPA: hypothetical protein VFV34_03870 [Blastocatellia bacterium]|nr:hypothetical protein [Blastocatellia bacterium]
MYKRSAARVAYGATIAYAVSNIHALFGLHQANVKLQAQAKA